MPEELPQSQTETRKLAAIMFTDIVGFSRQMGSNEARTLRLLDVHNRIIQQTVSEHHGHVIKTIGDAFLVEFPSVVHAVQCAQQIHTQFRIYNAEQEQTEQIHVRIGIHLGDIVQREGDVFGDGVNIASRLQSLAEPDTSCISQAVYHEVHTKLDLGTIVSLGKPKLKNIAERFQVYALLPQAPQGVRQQLRVQRLKLSRHKRLVSHVVVGLLLIVVPLVAVRYLPFVVPNSELRTPNSQLPLPDKPSIVVLPFVNMSNDPEQDYFSNGITEVLTSDLSRIANLFVIARNTAFTYKGKASNVQEVGKELGVRYVLEGSVQRAGEQVRIVAQLIDTTTGGPLWSQRFDRPFADIFALQDEIVKKIMTTLKLQFTVQEQGYLVRKHTDNLEAYDSLLRGIEPFWRYTKEAHAQARQMFENAIALDPQYAEAYARLSFIYYREWFLRWSMVPQTLERAFELAQQAVALDDSLPLAHSILSQVYTQKRQYDQAIAEGERAIALDPNNTDSYQWQANVLNFVGRPAEALQMIEQAMRLNPRYPPFYLFELGWAYTSMGRYTEAITTLREFLSRSPSHPPGHHLLALSYVYQWASQQNAGAQTLEQAVITTQQGIALNDAYFVGHRALGTVYLWQKQYEPAIAELEQAIALDPNMADGYAFLAETLSRVGRPKEALRAAEQALHFNPLVVDYHLDSVGATYYLAGRPEDAIAPLKKFLLHYPNILGAHLTLAAVYSELGKDTEARAEVAEVLRINPRFSLEVHKQRTPIKDPAVLERHIAALRKAGLQ
jgi:TolB-like protein/class 3 adenylate cyclase/Tfp pilus assembly protein PilF